MSNSSAEPADDPVSVVVTAGYDHAPQAVALTQLLHRDRVKIAQILVVRSLEARRVAQVVRSGGFKALRAAGRKALGRGKRSSGDAGPIAQFFRSHGLEKASLARLAERHRVPYARVASLNTSEAVGLIRGAGAHGLVYCGGGILRPVAIEAAERRVLNAHAGPLPQIRGMNAVEWSLLTGAPLQVTIHYIDAGVDTGPTLDVRPIGLQTGDTVELLRDRSIIAGIEGLRDAVRRLPDPMPPRHPQAAAHAQYFTVAQWLRPLLEKRLGERLLEAD